MSVPLLSCDNMRYTYSGSLKETLLGVHLDLYPGEITAIVGHSGAGKSTLLHLLSGMIPWQEGRVKWNNEEYPASIQNMLFAHTAIVFQESHLIPYLTVEENIYLGQVFGIPSAMGLKEITTLLGLEGKEQQRAGTLSGGQKQRVAIGRALMKGAPLILADEPTSSLDEQTGQEILQLFAQLAHVQKKAICFVTHELDTLTKADRVFELKNGLLTEKK